MKTRPRTETMFLLGSLLLFSVTAGWADTIRLKNGREIQGQVVSYGNGEFIVLVPSTSDRPSSQDRRILLVESVESIKFDAAPAIAPGPSEDLIVLDASREVVPTGVQVRRGDRIHVTASGQLQFSDGRVSGPAGLDTRETWPFPGERFGVLIAVVGDPKSSSIYYVVGEEDEFEARTDGEVFLQINSRSLQGARGAYTARISRPGAVETASPTPASTEPAIPAQAVRYDREIPANREWTDTEIDVLAGDTIRFSTQGTIHYTSTKTCGPDGASREITDLFRALPVNDVGRGALIGLIGQAGTATPFFVGATAEFKIEKAGRLFLGINDDKYDNNTGSFKTQIDIMPGNR